MGTNFYLYSPRRGQGEHIGKRSAAGNYCWDCHVTLCKAGPEHVHDGCTHPYHETIDQQFACWQTRWYEACPVCGKKPGEEPLDRSAAGQEPGCNKTAPKQKTGVASCSSFTWAMDPSRFSAATTGKRVVAVDDYGERYTKKQFRAVLAECPIVLTDMVGEDFF